MRGSVPEKEGGDAAVGSGTGFEEARSKEGGGEPGPASLLFCGFVKLSGGVGHCCLQCIPPPRRKCVKVLETKGLGLDYGVRTGGFAGKVFDSNRLSVQGDALNLDGGGSVVVILAVSFVGAGEFFEKVGVLDWGGDFVVAGGPFAEVDAAAAVGAEREVFASGEDDIAAGGTAEGFDFRVGSSRHGNSILIHSWV